MKQEIEIEFKNMVTKNEFQTLCEAFSITSFIEQTNHYFETKNFALKETGSALRIRFKSGSYILTLKQPAEIGLLETHQRLTEQEAEQMMETGIVVPGSVANQLQALHIPLQLSYFGSLTTKRAETMYKEGLLIFDHSFYFNHDDYELEYEVKDESKKTDFLSLLGAYNIPVRPTQNKVQRFFLAKQNNAL
ncbi:CYTH domain-containing protein [Ectobacillus panaciterrae]|uniref:CYTH domain-containing protein n=1 Tax=Ectobacillus panaciterrae TaxID=363872 RepID=UPI0003F73970|nr:CYTH domain-containing protein [Ectobacillus panaciterrae]